MTQPRSSGIPAPAVDRVIVPAPPVRGGPAPRCVGHPVPAVVVDPGPVAVAVGHPCRRDSRKPAVAHRGDVSPRAVVVKRIHAVDVPADIAVGARTSQLPIADRGPTIESVPVAGTAHLELHPGGSLPQRHGLTCGQAARAVVHGDLSPALANLDDRCIGPNVDSIAALFLGPDSRERSLNVDVSCGVRQFAV